MKLEDGRVECLHLYCIYTVYNGAFVMVRALIFWSHLFKSFLIRSSRSRVLNSQLIYQSQLSYELFLALNCQYWQRYMVKYLCVGRAKYAFLARGNAKVNKTKQNLCIFYFENHCVDVCFVYSVWFLVSAFYSKTWDFSILLSFIFSNERKMCLLLDWSLDFSFRFSWKTSNYRISTP